MIIRARYGSISAHPQPTHPEKNGTFIQSQISTARTITNEKSGRSAQTSGGNAKDKNTIYAAKCKNCQLIYIGQTSRQLNERFNIHRSDILHHPERCELPKHFHDSLSCSFNRDLEIHVLQQGATGSQAMREMEEDKWILKLNTLEPMGMNMKLNEYGNTFMRLSK